VLLAPWGRLLGASEPVLVEEFRDWAVYTYEERGRKHCYVATYSIARRGQAGGRTDSWLLVSNDPSSGLRHSVSFTLDRPLHPEHPVRATVGDRTFELVAEGDTAWTPSENIDLRLVVAMKRGRRIVVSATDAHGGVAIDTFSLMGFTKALDAVAERCRG
jgi:hypothetical protein